MKAIIELDVPDYQIGQKVSIYFKDTMMIKAIVQESCVDVVSRQAAIDALTKTSGIRGDALKALYELPPVNLTKTGHWIDDNENEIDAQYGRHLYKCSECNEYASAFVGGTEDWWDIEKPNYCPNCGSRMVEPQERSGEE